MLWLKQSTSITVKIGPFVDSTDGNTVETGLTIAQADVRLSKNGGNIAQKTEATSCTHDELGIYGCPIDATDTATLGRLQLWVHESGALPVWHEFMVVSANTWDSFFAAENLDVNAAEISGDATAADNAEAFFDGTGYAGTNNVIPTVTALTGHTAQTADHTAGIAAIPTAAEVVNEWETQSQADPTGFHVNVMESLSQPGKFDSLYGGLAGPGVWIDAGANTNTVSGVDGIHSNPVSTLTAARTIADALGYKTYYLLGGISLTIAATHEDWHFIGLGEPTSNRINLGSQDVDRSGFVNLEVVGIQGGTGRIVIRGGAINDPGAGATTLHVFACATMFTGDFELDTSNDNIFDQCFSGVAGAAAPVIIATGAAGTAVFRHYSGGIEFKALSASHNISCETDGQVIFNADCNVNATVALRGNMTITDNTAGMNNLSRDAALSGAYVNTQADTALTDYGGPTNAEMEARTLVAASYFDPAADAVANVTLVATTTTNTDVRGTDSAALASVCTETRLAELDAANLPTDIADIPTVAEFNARTQPTADYFDPAADAVANVTLVATTTTNTDVRGTDNAALASVCTEARLAELAAANLPTDIAALPTTAEVNTEVDTALSDIHLDHLLAADYDPASKPGTATALLNELVESDGGVSRFTENALEQAPSGTGASAATIADAVWDEAAADHVSAGSFGVQAGTDIDAILADTNELQTDDVPGLIAALNDIAVTDITQRQIPDSVPADGTLPTVEQALYMITQFLHERAVSGTTVTVRKVDGSTSLLTLTLDDGTDPTSITRAT